MDFACVCFSNLLRYVNVSVIGRLNKFLSILPVCVLRIVTHVLGIYMCLLHCGFVHFNEVSLINGESYLPDYPLEDKNNF